MVKTQSKENRKIIKQPADFELIYQQHIRQVYGYLYSILGNVQDAEDISGQTFLSVYESLHTFKGASSIKSWIFRIARNKAMDHFRKRKRIVTGELPEMPVNNDPLHDVIRSEQSQFLAGLMKDLPEHEVELLRLRFLAQMTFAEMAEFLGRHEDAVKKSVYRLVGRLKNQVEDSHE